MNEGKPIDIRLTREPLDVAAATAWITCAEAGGISLFLGTTRAETLLADARVADADGNKAQGELTALDYHAYEAMAVKEIEKLAEEARQRWPVMRLLVWHRLGLVRVGEASVMIAVSCGHRGEAFDACEFMIDALKKIAPIWKREVYQEGSMWQGEKKS